MKFAIDISAYQAPASLHWEHLPPEYEAVYIRASAGTKADKHAPKHAQAARNAKRAVGFYHYVRDDSSAKDQFLALQSVFETIGQSEDLAIALDFEWQPKDRTPDPKTFVPLTEEFIQLVTEEYGAPLCYTNRNFFQLMKRPAAWSTLDQWLADYRALTTSPKNLDPARGTSPCMWQYRVAPLPKFCEFNLDQNRILSPLPRVA